MAGLATAVLADLETRLRKMNDNHDERGRFASSDSGDSEISQGMSSFVESAAAGGRDSLVASWDRNPQAAAKIKNETVETLKAQGYGPTLTVYHATTEDQVESITGHGFDRFTSFSLSESAAREAVTAMGRADKVIVLEAHVPRSAAAILATSRGEFKNYWHQKEILFDKPIPYRNPVIKALLKFNENHDGRGRFSSGTAVAEKPTIYNANGVLSQFKPERATRIREAIGLTITEPVAIEYGVGNIHLRLREVTGPNGSLDKPIYLLSIYSAQPGDDMPSMTGRHEGADYRSLMGIRDVLADIHERNPGTLLIAMPTDKRRSLVYQHAGLRPVAPEDGLPEWMKAMGDSLLIVDKLRLRKDISFDVAMVMLAELAKFNPNHDEAGRFSESDASGASSKQDAFDNWAYNSAQMNELLNGESPTISGEGKRLSDSGREALKVQAQQIQSLAESNRTGLYDVYRGESYKTEGDVKSKYPYHGDITFEGLVSASDSKDTAMVYAKGGYDEGNSENPVKVMVEIGTNHPDGVRGTKTFNFFTPEGGTGEVILPKGDTYKVMGRSYDPSLGAIRVSLYRNETGRKTIEADLAKENPNHDERGRFSSADSSGDVSKLFDFSQMEEVGRLPDNASGFYSPDGKMYNVPSRDHSRALGWNGDFMDLDTHIARMATVQDAGWVRLMTRGGSGGSPQMILDGMVPEQIVKAGMHQIRGMSLDDQRATSLFINNRPSPSDPNKPSGDWRGTVREWILQGKPTDNSYTPKYAIARRLIEAELAKFNPNHDERGRFAEATAEAIDSPQAMRTFEGRQQPKISRVQEIAIESYKGSGYRTLNAYLRGRAPIMRAVDVRDRENSMKALDSALAKAPATKAPVVVYRYVSSGFPLSEMREGRQFVERGYMSTTLDEDAAIVSGGGSHMIEISVPKGVRAISTDRYGDNNLTRSEHELLFPRNSRLRIDYVNQMRPGRVLIRATYLGTEPDDPSIRAKTRIFGKAAQDGMNMASNRFTWDDGDIEFLPDDPEPDKADKLFAAVMAGLNAELGKENPNHDEHGRFASGDGDGALGYQDRKEVSNRLAEAASKAGYQRFGDLMEAKLPGGKGNGGLLIHKDGSYGWNIEHGRDLKPSNLVGRFGKKGTGNTPPTPEALVAFMASHGIRISRPTIANGGSYGLYDEYRFHIYKGLEPDLIKYNANHDEHGRFASAPSDGGSENADTRDKALAYLNKNYDPKVLSWATDAHWHFAQVPINLIDYARRPGGRDAERAASIAQAVTEGKVQLSPLVLVAKPNGRYALADGYHRTGVYAKLGHDAAPAYVASGIKWTPAMERAQHAGKLNKSATSEFPGLFATLVNADLSAELAKFNPYHDEQGRFSSGDSTGARESIEIRNLDRNPTEWRKRFDSPDIVAARQRMQAIPLTFTNNSPERVALREQVGNTTDSQIGLADRGEIKRIFGTYTPTIKQERRADLVFGPPAAGKSTISEPLMRDNSARLLDSDEIKKQLPEYNNGIGANAVHEESSRIVDDHLFHLAISRGDNFVWPMLGKRADAVNGLIDVLTTNGYKVHLHYVDLPLAKAAGRAIARFHKTGRFVDPEVIRSIDHLPPTAWEDVKTNPNIKSYEKWSTESGKPKLIERGEGPARKRS